jgi:hypothetical protein
MGSIDLSIVHDDRVITIMFSRKSVAVHYGHVVCHHNVFRVSNKLGRAHNNIILQLHGPYMYNCHDAKSVNQTNAQWICIVSVYVEYHYWEHYSNQLLVQLLLLLRTVLEPIFTSNSWSTVHAWSKLILDLEGSWNLLVKLLSPVKRPGGASSIYGNVIRSIKG